MFRRCVLVIEKEQDAPAALMLALRFAPCIERLVIVSKLSLSLFHWIRKDPWATMEDCLVKGETKLSQLKILLPPQLPELETQIFVELTPKIVIQVIKDTKADLLLTTQLSYSTAPHLLNWYSTVAHATKVPLISLPPLDTSAHPKEAHHLEKRSLRTPIQRWFCVFQKAFQHHPAITTFLQKHATEKQHLTILSVQPGSPAYQAGEIDKLTARLGVQAKVEVQNVGSHWLGQLDTLVQATHAAQSELLIAPLEDMMGSIWGFPLLSRHALSELNVPVLFVPPIEVPIQHEGLATPDILWLDPKQVLLYAERTDIFGLGAAPFTGELQAFIKGQEAVTAHFTKGYATLQIPAGLSASPQILGLGMQETTEEDSTSTPTLEATIRFFEPKDKSVVLYDSELSDASIQCLLERTTQADLHPVGIRLRRHRFLGHLRRGSPSAPWVLDAGQVLDDGDPSDLPPGTEALRLMRVAMRMRAKGVQIVGMVAKEARLIAPKGFVLWQEKDFSTIDDELFVQQISQQFVAPLTRPNFSEQLEELTQTPILVGNEMTPVFENQSARKKLIELVKSAKNYVHIQVYIIHDDETTAEFEKAIQEAANRGVIVRLIVDSLYSLHGSFGMKNPWIQRISAIENVEVRLFRPIKEFPDLEDLKRRDHRKFTIVDGEIAVITGRNFASSYYKGFEEVTLAPNTPEREIPWMDTGVHVKGPIVQAVEESFLHSWEQAGGSHFSLPTVASISKGVRCRLIQHEGLQDTYSLDAQLALIREAKRKVTIVNTFPLQKEILHVLLKAIERGVHVRILIGSVRPLYGENQTFPGNPIRLLATQVVLSRIDHLIAAGGEAFSYAMAPLPHWDPTLERVQPHVHAKIMTCDGFYTVLGSANFDITGGFWESEALLMIEDQNFTTQFDQQLDRWIEQSIQLKPSAPGWEKNASMREWLDLVWPSLIA